MCDLKGKNEAKTFRITCELNFKDGRKPKKVVGLVSGMCKECALEKTRSTMHQIGRITEGAKNFKILKVKTLKTDWMIVPREDDNFNSLEDFLQNKSKHDVGSSEFADRLKEGFVNFLRKKAESEGNSVAFMFAEALANQDHRGEQSDPLRGFLDNLKEKMSQSKEAAEAKAKYEADQAAKADINMNDAPDGVQAEEVETKIGE